MSFLRYAITDPRYFHLEHTEAILPHLRDRCDMILYRNITTQSYQKEAHFFVSQAQKFGFDRILIHANVQLAAQLMCGVHLRSTQHNDVAVAKRYNLFTVVSCHSLQEIYHVAALGADLVTLSPVFQTSQKANPLGIERFDAIVRKAPIGVVALGGVISQEHIMQVKQTAAAGFASIRYFFDATYY